jgi:hypothetical protein
MKWGLNDTESITCKIMNDAEIVMTDDEPLIYPDDVDFGFEEKEMDDPYDFQICYS